MKKGEKALSSSAGGLCGRIRERFWKAGGQEKYGNPYIHTAMATEG